MPRRLGGLEQGLLALAFICEEIAKACPSAALCYGMHSVATAVIAAKATKDQEERYLRPAAEGRHLTTLALSEAAVSLDAIYDDAVERLAGIRRSSSSCCRA